MAEQKLVKAVKEFVDIVTSKAKEPIKVVRSDDFEFLNYDLILHWNPYAVDESGFMEHLLHCHNYDTDISYFTIALLHEIGHFNTFLKIPNKVVEDEARIIADTFYEFDDNEEVIGYKTDVDYNVYYNLRSEQDATEQAIRYMKRNKKLIQQQDNYFKELLPKKNK